MVESINGHMTRYLETCDRRKEEIENYGIPWKVMEGWKKRNCIYIHYLVTNQASIFLASDFCVLVCFVLSSLLQVYQQAGILENSAIIYLVPSSLYFSASFLVCLLITTYLWDQVKEKFWIHFSPNNQATPWPGTGPGSLRYIVCLTPNTLPSSQRLTP